MDSQETNSPVLVHQSFALTNPVKKVLEEILKIADVIQSCAPKIYAQMASQETVQIAAVLLWPMKPQPRLPTQSLLIAILISTASKIL